MITDHPDLPETKGLPGKQTFSVKNWTASGKSEWLVTLYMSKGLRELIKDDTIKVTLVSVDP